MREILFRGKTEKGKWVCGDFVSNGCGIAYTDYLNEYGDVGEVYRKVVPETIGQYTGLTDKNGKKIFEGDIVKIYEDIDYRIGVHKTNRKTRTIIGVVVFDEKRFEYHIKNEEYNLTLFRLSKRDTNEVIGNIHDNPELLEREVEGE